LAVALTFDDGPSPSTPKLLDVLEQYGVKATFFQCGMHARRLPGIVRKVSAAGHELGNHTDTHARLWLESPRAIEGEIGRAQSAIFDAGGVTPRLFRAPYGVRWFGLRAAQHKHGLLGVMWTVIGRDWSLKAAAVADRVVLSARPGTIVCLHDGREREPFPSIENTIEAVTMIVPRLRDAGYVFSTVSELLDRHPVH
jgi:peptidoglycan/xylan/chitin deacetylase (PgdA/CDA1 family)